MSVKKNRAAAVGLIYKNLILLARRAETYQGKPCTLGGYWSIFAGSIEKGESPMTCAIRELYEESQIKIGTEELNYAQTIQGEGNLVELHVYFCHLKELINPVLDFEHTAYMWYKIDDLNSFTDPIDPKIVSILEEYYKNFENWHTE